MTKPLCKYEHYARKGVAERRIKADTKGLGYWAARDFFTKRPNVSLGLITSKASEQ